MRFARSRDLACESYEARLEDYLHDPQGPGVSQLAAHLERCAACRDALEVARLAGPLLREGLEPAGDMSGALMTRVLANIRAEEQRLAARDLSRPLEALATRLALTAAAALLVLGVFLYEYGSAPWLGSRNTQTELSELAPEPAAQPADKDQVLLTLAENNHGR